LRDVQNIRELKLRTDEIHRDTTNYPTVKRCFLTGEKAYEWLLYLMYVTMIFMVVLIVVEVTRFII